MKNSTVELMIRNQFNIPNRIYIKIDCLASTSDWYDFECTWWVEDEFRKCTCRLPHIDYSSEQY